MTIDGKVGSFGFSGERAHTVDHPPIFKASAVKDDNGSYPAGLVLAVDGNGDLVPCEDLATETIAGINDAPVDTAQDDVAKYVAHGTVKSDMLIKGAAGSALTAADRAKLKTLGIDAVEGGNIMYTTLRGLFAAQAVASYLQALPDLKSTVLDLLFPDRPTHPFPLLGAEELLAVLNEVPVVLRGGRSVPTGAGSTGVSFYEPLPVKPSREITGQDLNNLRMLLGNKASLNAYAQGVVDQLRRICRKTTEGMAATALTGTLKWPVKLEGGGWESLEIQFGDPLTAVPPKLLDADGANLADLYTLCSMMRTTIQNAGVGGGEVGFVAGQSVFAKALTIAENIKTTAKHNIRVELNDGAVVVGNFEIRECAETYRNPQSGALVKKIPDHKLLAYAKDTPGKIFYCALDDVDGNLQAMPFLPRVDKLPEGVGLKVIGQSKPMPVRSPKTLCWADAVTAE